MIAQAPMVPVAIVESSRDGKTTIARVIARAAEAHPSTGPARVRTGADSPGMSERGMWDALDEGRDPTDGDPTDGDPTDRDPTDEGR